MKRIGKILVASICILLILGFVMQEHLNAETLNRSVARSSDTSSDLGAQHPPNTQTRLAGSPQNWFQGTNAIAAPLRDGPGINLLGAGESAVSANSAENTIYLPLVLEETDGTPLPIIEILHVKVSFQGRDNAQGQPQNVPIRIRIKNQSDDLILFESDWVAVTPAGESNNWGTVSVDVSNAGLVPNETYRVFVKGAMHLAKQITISLVDGQTIDYTDTVLNPDGFLRSGDVDQDNQVGASDLSLLLSNWGQTPPPDPDPHSVVYRCELNGDGAISQPDLDVLLSSYGMRGDPY